jgi:L-threonylcarbamoyladenylate synthase
VASLGGRIALVVDDGATEAGVESTIVYGLQVLRPGPVTAEDLARFGDISPAPPLHFPGEGRGPVEGDVQASTALSSDPATPGPRPSPGKRVKAGEEGEAAIITAPGQLASHYAPNKPLRLNATEAEADEYLIGFGEVAGDASLSAHGDLTDAAAALFDALHRADASDRARIAIAPILLDGIGAAINDRLRRGSARRRGGDDRLPPARTQRYAETVFDRSAKLLRSFASLGGITAMQYGLRWPSLSQ